MSLFDLNSFLDAATTEESKRRPPLPAGTELVATIGEPKARSWTGKQDPSRSGIAVDLPLEFDLKALGREDLIKHVGGLEKVTITHGIMLDLTEAGTIDYSPGKNGRIRLYREALGLNVPGQQFALRMLQGRQIRAKIKHRPGQNADEIYEDIEAVAKPA